MRQIISFLIITFLLLVAGWRPAAADGCGTRDCHPFLKTLPNLHQPVKDGDCFACHEQKNTQHPLRGVKTYPLKAQGEKLCYLCHDRVATKEFVHEPVKGGDCIACHRAHGATGKHLLDTGSSPADLCFTCHEAKGFRGHHQHGPVAAGDCTSCHGHHDAPVAKLLKKESRELCLDCHSDFASAMKGAILIHPPVAKGACTACHNPHSSASRFILKEDMPELCYSCHDKLAKKTMQARVQHKPISQAKSCSSCHSSHFSAAKGLLPTDQKSLCLGCHDSDGLKSGKGYRNLSGVPLQNMKKALDGKKQLHGPVVKGECSSCHAPHGSDNMRLLVKAYPADFYAPYKEGAYDLCLSCHDKNLLKYADTTMYTRFRNGKQNLHYLHVNDQRKGRSCRACHDAHAVDGKKLIGNDGAKFGDWRVPTRLSLTPTGGSCAPGCHRPVRYDREKPESYAEGK
jgi:predicted CXXCH cytochrome family protein